ncbi:hypothetical protein JCM15754A_19280 [Prevotella aurantiaca JCM 15754]
MNILLKTDNLVGLEYLIKQRGLAGKIDLIYTDPPFATNGNFTITNGRATTISNSQRGEVAYSDKLTGKEFVEYIKKRVILMHELLSDKGSFYIHTDYKIGHYVKVMLDEVFGIENFRNDITRIKCNPKNFNKIGYGNIKDMILFYSKGQNPIWNEPRTTYTDEDINRLFKKNKNGRPYTTVPIHAPGETLNPQKFKGMLPPVGRHWRTDVETLNQWDKEGLIEWSANGVPRKIVYADERKGKRVQDIWEYKDPQYPIYPTEKNIDFIKMIVETSSNKDSIVLDPFCGSGTTLQAATSLSRKWIGIDQSDLAIKTTKDRMGVDEVSLFENDTEFIDLTKCKKNFAQFSQSNF